LDILDVLTSIPTDVNKTLAEQFQDNLRANIQNSNLAPGDKLPSLQNFKTAFEAKGISISAPTINDMLNPLRDESIIYTINNVGSFVTESEEEMRERLYNETKAAFLPICEHYETLPAIPFDKGIVFQKMSDAIIREHLEQELRELILEKLKQMPAGELWETIQNVAKDVQHERKDE